MNIVLFSDLHGRILLALKLVARLQRERGIKVDLILQCGDVGIYPVRKRMDRATIQHAKKDPTELGFMHYFVEPQPEVEAVLSELDCQMVCVRGNHEDHEYLNALEQKASGPRFPIDCYGRIEICKTGHLQEFEFGGAKLSVMGIGRIGTEKERGHDRFLQPYEKQALQRFAKSKGHADLLITHDSSIDFVSKGFGMPETRAFLDQHKPLHQFYGHTGYPFSVETDLNQFTQVWKIAELEMTEEPLDHGSMLLLKWQDMYEHEVEVIEDDWIKEYRRSNWLAL